MKGSVFVEKKIRPGGVSWWRVWVEEFVDADLRVTPKYCINRTLYLERIGQRERAKDVLANP
jgi:hypothetical protein